MGTIRGGEIECDRCGSLCKALHGFAMTVNRVASTHNENVKKIIQEIDKKYGKHDFIICWDCTIDMMGIKPLPSPVPKPEPVSESKEDITAVFEE